jgi:alpha-tubulin suppressor-like RCC1 family protein
MKVRISAAIGAVVVLAAACASTASAPAVVTVKQVSGGWNHALALKSDGSVWAWGGNTNGELGDGTTAGTLVPIQVKAIGRKVIAIAAGWDSSVALKADGSVWAWGANDRGQLGSGSNVPSSTPVKVTGLNGRFTAIAAGLGFGLALRSDGTVWGWGDDFQGQLGNGSNDDTTTAVEAVGLAGRVVAIAAGKAHSLALKSDGTLWAWGDNGSHALGADTAGVFQNTPVAVQGLGAGVVAMAGGLEHSAAVKSDGSVWSWGRAFIPSGDYMGTLTPTQVPGLTGVKQVAGGWDFFIALESNGSVWAWGQNLGDLGDGSGRDSLTNPVHVLGLDKGVVAIAAAQEDGYAVRSDHSVWAWGNNNYGELGNGTKDPQGGSNVPVAVKSF